MTASVMPGRFAGLDAPSERPAVNGNSVVCVGSNIPPELITARGLIPTYLTGEIVSKTPRADEYLEGKYGAEFRSILQQLLDGVADPATLVVFDRRFRDVFYYVKEMVRLGRLPQLPPVYLFDLIISRSVDATKFNLQQIRQLDDVLALAAAGRSGQPLAAVVKADNAWRAQVRRLLDHRRARRIAGLEAFGALSAVRWLGRTEHGRRLAGLNDRLAAAPLGGRVSGPAALLVSGEPLYHDRLHRAVEAAGALVLGEDSEWGSRLAGGDVAEGSYGALLERYWTDATGDELRPFPARIAWLMEAVTMYRPDVVLLWIPPSDTSFGWDVPRLAGQVRAAGAHPVLFRGDVLSGVGLDAAVSELSRALADTTGAAG